MSVDNDLTTEQALHIPTSAHTSVVPDYYGSPRAEWLVLSVDDDAEYQASIDFTINGLNYEKLPIKLLTASSAAQAALVLAENPEIAVILLDVVMEEDDAGLRLVDTIRERLGNRRIRIVLLTGQPGMAPRDDIMSHYRIDDYWNKTDLFSEQLHTLITSNLRTWQYIDEIERARHGLQLLVDASRELTGQRDLTHFTNTILEQIDQLIGTKEGGIVSALTSGGAPLDDAQIFAASGCFKGIENQSLAALPTDLHEDVEQARQKKTSIFRDKHTVLWFKGLDNNSQEYLTIICSKAKMSDYHMKLLQVFSHSASNGFANIALTNRLSELAYYDTLLHIHNRNWLIWEIGRLTSSERVKTQLLLVDMDRFSDLHVSLGNDFSEQVICALYERLKDTLHDYLSIARVGPDSFAVLTLCDDAPDRNLIDKLYSTPILIGEDEHDLSLTTVSMALRDMKQMSPSQILHMGECCIDTARRNSEYFFLYRPEVHDSIRYRYHLMHDLRRALKLSQLSIYLQPKVKLDTGEVVGFEALARWIKEDGTYVPPDEFIGLAETAGLIGQLDEYVLNACCEALHELQAAGIELPVAFNASTLELLETDYFDNLNNIISAHEISPSMLELEITETQAMHNYASIRDRLQHLIDLGMGVSIDDFGTGYSSLAHMTNLTATTLKIDKCFIQDLEHSHAAEHVVDMILRLSRRFGFSVIAEGVETEAQRLTLLDKGCLLGQGFLFSRPLPVSEIIERVKEQRFLGGVR